MLVKGGTGIINSTAANGPVTQEVRPLCDIDHNNKVHGANMGPTWDQQDAGGPHVGPMNFALWGPSSSYICAYHKAGLMQYLPRT